MFVGEFTLEAACSVATCARLHREDISAGIAKLLASSLLESSCGRDTGVHCLLTLPTRSFALSKLVCDGEQDLIARKHAQYLQCVLEYAEVECLGDPRLDALVTLTREFVAERGFVAPKIWERFAAAGFDEVALMEVLIGLALKGISNYLDNPTPIAIG
jgi:hypothetical protein